MYATTLKSISTFAVAVILMSQLLFVGNVLLMPKPAQAILGIGDTTIIVGNIYDALKDAGIAAAKTIALRFVDGFLTRFMNKVVEKYKIRNFVYYDQVLTDYYLTNFIRDKVNDPDLQNIFLLLDSAYIAGNNTGYTGVNPNNAIIPQLKKKINDLYIKRGGVDPNLITNPPADISGYDYYSASYNYYLNPPDNTASSLLSQYGNIKSSVSMGAQLEVLVGGGYKSGRFLGGSCTLGSGSTSTVDAADQATCTEAGGTWAPSGLDYARSFIDNPGQFAHDFVSTSIDVLVGSNYDPNNIWSAVGSLMGNFLYNRLALNSNAGVLSDGGLPYSGATGTAAPKSLDFDNDGIIDAYDFDNNGTPDSCVFQGIAPNCMGSIEATTVTETDTAPADALTKHPDQSGVVEQVKADLSAQGISFADSCGSFRIVNEVAARVGAGILSKPGGHRCEVNGSGYSVDVIIFSDGYTFDVLVASSDPGTTGQNGATWIPGPITDTSRFVNPYDSNSLGGMSLNSF